MKRNEEREIRIEEKKIKKRKIKGIRGGRNWSGGSLLRLWGILIWG